MALVTLASAKAQLLIDSSDARDEDIRSKIEIAEALVLTYIKSTLGSPADWADEDAVPKVVKGAILYQVAELHRFRGDDEAGPQRNPYRMLSPMVEGMLSHYRDPTLA